MAVVPLLFLHDGTTMLIPPDMIPNPPAFRIQQGMQGIVDLNARWDDHPDHWGGRSHLVIMGHPILQYYWHHIYPHRFPKQWSKIKSQWGHCEVRTRHFNSSTAYSPLAQAVVNWFRLGTEDDFRAVFCDAYGVRWSIEDICGHIQKEKAKEDWMVAAQATKGLGKAVTTYRKGSAVFTTQNPRVIARKARAQGFVLSPRPPPPVTPTPDVPQAVPLTS